MEVDDLAARVLVLVHHPEAPAVDRAHVHFEFDRQFRRIDLRMGLRGDGKDAAV